VSLKAGTATRDRKSLPAYIFGLRLAQMCKTLEGIKAYSGSTKIKGAGKIIFDAKQQSLRGEQGRITENSYFKNDKERYLECLENFRHGWDYYLSVLETDIIEMKLMTILDSLTFKYTRQPQFLRVQPERLTVRNLRISEKIKILN
jgi:hypothetical protein